MKNLKKRPVKILTVLWLSTALIFSGNVFAAAGGQIAVERQARIQADAALQSQIVTIADAVSLTDGANQSTHAALQSQIVTIADAFSDLYDDLLHLLRVYEIADVLTDDSIVFWVDETGRHGLAAQPLDAQDPIGEDTIMTWWSAKRAADEYGPGWRLPTIHEIRLLSLQHTGLFPNPNVFYWSSTEIDNESAWQKQIAGDTLSGSSEDKAVHRHARAVRSF